MYMLNEMTLNTLWASFQISMFEQAYYVKPEQTAITGSLKLVTRNLKHDNQRT